MISWILGFVENSTTFDIPHQTLRATWESQYCITRHLNLSHIARLSRESALSRDTTFAAGLYELSSAHIWDPAWFILHGKTNHRSRFTNCKTSLPE